MVFYPAVKKACMRCFIICTQDPNIFFQTIVLSFCCGLQFYPKKLSDTIIALFSFKSLQNKYPMCRGSFIEGVYYDLFRPP